MHENVRETPNKPISCVRACVRRVWDDRSNASSYVFVCMFFSVVGVIACTSCRLTCAGCFFLQQGTVLRVNSSLCHRTTVVLCAGSGAGAVPLCCHPVLCASCASGFDDRHRGANTRIARTNSSRVLVSRVSRSLRGRVFRTTTTEKRNIVLRSGALLTFILLHTTYTDTYIWYMASCVSFLIPPPPPLNRGSAKNAMQNI